MIKSSFFASQSPMIRLLLVFAIFMAASMIPIFGAAFLLMLPQLIIVFYLQNNWIKTVTAFLIPFAVLSVILVVLNNIFPALLLAAMGVAGTTMAWAVRKNYSVETIIIIPCAILLGLIVIYFLSSSAQLSISPWQLLEKQMGESVDLNISFYSRLPLDPEEINAIKNSKDSIVRLFTDIFPALCVIGVISTIWINLLTARLILMKSGILSVQWLNLSEWKAPAWLVWFFLASGGAILIPQTYIHWTGVNTFMIVSFVYFIQGFAIVSFFFQKKNISLFFRCLFYFFVAIQQILMVAIALLGFFDLWIDFRKYFRNGPQTD